MLSRRKNLSAEPWMLAGQPASDRPGYLGDAPRAHGVPAAFFERWQDSLKWQHCSRYRKFAIELIESHGMALCGLSGYKV